MVLSAALPYSGGVGANRTRRPAHATRQGRARPPERTKGVDRAMTGTLVERIPRPIRFGFVGGTCAVLQLGLLFGLVHLGLERHAANVLAFLLSTQVNFALSSIVTWRDRQPPVSGRATV